MSQSIVFYLHIHQPWRLQPYSVFDSGVQHDYFSANDEQARTNNQTIFRKVAQKSYWPMTTLLLKLLARPGFTLNLSITGTFLEQCELWDPALLQQFQKLVATGRVEIIGETYHHSLAFFYSRFEFEKQVLMHREKIEQIFGLRPRIFRNTELSYNNNLATWAASAGYSGVLCEGWDPVLSGRSPNFVYRATGTSKLKLLLKNYRLSDDLAFRFSDRQWPEWPLDAVKYQSWLEAIPANEPLINLFMDFETFGEHQWKETGIFEMFEQFVDRWTQDGRSFVKVSDALLENEPVGDITMPDTVTWADNERDLSAWLGNRMQTEAMRYLYDLEPAVLRTSDEQLIKDWRLLQTSDHTYYMCTKWFNDGDVHAYFSPYESPYDAFVYYLNAIRDIRWRVSEHHKGAIS